MNYDYLVIGAGPGGYTSAIRAAQNGLKVAVVERRNVGGTCLNEGCIPTKCLLHEAEIFCNAKSFESSLCADAERIYGRKNNVISKLRNGIEGLLKANNIDLLTGEAKFKGANEIEVNGEIISANKIAIATGTRPLKPGFLTECMTSDDILKNDLPLFKSVCIIGGGVIGVELATFYIKTGAEVTIIELADNIIPTFPLDCSKYLALALRKLGVKINLAARVESVHKDDSNYIINYISKDKSLEIKAEAAICAIGRKPNSENLGLENTRVQTERGFIMVDKNYETSERGVYAFGDVAYGSIQLAHFAEAAGVFVADNLTTQKKKNLSVVPACIYTSPEVAFVGMSEEKAKSIGIETEVGKVITGANSKSVVLGEERGFFKVIFEKATDKLIGAEIVAPSATEIIGGIAALIASSNTREEIKRVIFPHPTVSEAFFEAVEDSENKAIHNAPKKRD